MPPVVFECQKFGEYGMLMTDPLIVDNVIAMMVVVSTKTMYALL